MITKVKVQQSDELYEVLRNNCVKGLPTMNTSMFTQMTEKYGDTFDTPKQKAKDAAKKKENTDRDLRMKHGKKWRDFTKDALDSKNKERNRLKTGEVKKLVDGKWVSNKS